MQRSEVSSPAIGQTPPATRSLVRMANVIILGIALLSMGAYAGTYFIGRTGLFRILPLSIGIIMLASLWLPATAKINVALCCFSAALAVYATEIYFTFSSTPRSIGQFPKLPDSFDIRSALEVVSDLRNQGLDAHGELAGRLLLVAGRSSLASESGAILPLGGISRKLTVFCNETGHYVTYQSDEHGFNNPPGIWPRRPVSIAALGDSFAQGFCTDPDQTFMALIRNRFPETLTLGMVGSGPLLELAALKEYLTAIKPKTVLWFFFEANDLQDLGDESQSPLLMKYVKQDGFSQHLIDKQAEIDRAWTQYEADLLSNWTKHRAPRWLRPMTDWLTDLTVEHKTRNRTARILRLREVRGRLEARFGRRSDEAAQLPLLRQTLAQAKETVNSWGGSLHFVFLPGMELLVNPHSVRAQLAQLVLQQPESLGIPVIDVRTSFQSHSIASIFFYPDSHYSELGAGLVASAVLSSLEHASAPNEHLQSVAAHEVMR
jgi:hypothetical protein